MAIAVTRMTSRGQVVIPQSIRRTLRLREGEELLVVEEEGTILLKPASRLSAAVEEELADMTSLARAWAHVDRGRASSASPTEFRRRLRSW